MAKYLANTNEKITLSDSVTKLSILKGQVYTFADIDEDYYDALSSRFSSVFGELKVFTNASVFGGTATSTSNFFNEGSLPLQTRIGNLREAESKHVIAIDFGDETFKNLTMQYKFNCFINFGGSSVDFLYSYFNDDLLVDSFGTLYNSSGHVVNVGSGGGITTAASWSLNGNKLSTARNESNASIVDFSVINGNLLATAHNSGFNAEGVTGSEETKNFTRSAWGRDVDSTFRVSKISFGYPNDFETTPDTDNNVEIYSAIMYPTNSDFSADSGNKITDIITTKRFTYGNEDGTSPVWADGVDIPNMAYNISDNNHLLSDGVDQIVYFRFRDNNFNPTNYYLKVSTDGKMETVSLAEATAFQIILGTDYSGEQTYRLQELGTTNVLKIYDDAGTLSLTTGTGISDHLGDVAFLGVGRATSLGFVYQTATALTDIRYVLSVGAVGSFLAAPIMGASNNSGNTNFITLLEFTATSSTAPAKAETNKMLGSKFMKSFKAAENIVKTLPQIKLRKDE